MSITEGSISIRDKIYKGTQAQYSADGQSDSMRVEAMVVIPKEILVTDERDGPALLRWATNRYFEEDGSRYFSPGHTALPLQRINVRQLARNLVSLTIDYGGRAQIGAPATIADFTAVTIPVTVFASPEKDDEQFYERGLPMGQLISSARFLIDPEADPDGDDAQYGYSTSIIGIPAESIDQLRTDTHERTAVRISLRKLFYGVNPVTTYASNLRTTSTNAIQVAGLSCGAGTLLLEGVTSNASSVVLFDPTGDVPSEQLLFDVSFQFLYDPAKFPVHRFSSLEDSGGRSTRDLLVVDQYQQTNWDV